MAKTYTIADLCALPDDALDAMAAELRGYHQELIGDSYSWFSPEIIIMPCEKWHPTTDRNQSYELLMYAVILRDVEFEVAFEVETPDSRSRISIWHVSYKGGLDYLSIPGNDARAETIAFCAAMLAMAGRLKGE